MIQLAWRFLRFQKDSALAQWFQARTADGRGNTRKTEAIATGINVHRVSAVAFGIGLGLAAAAGVFAPFMLGSITPAMGAEVTVTSFAVIVIGSLGNPLGTVLGGMVMQSYYTSWANLLPYVLLIAILLVRPGGLLGRRVRRITRLIHPKF
jgi:branched-chain amino acid transport system permease protein